MHSKAITTGNNTIICANPESSRCQPYPTIIVHHCGTPAQTVLQPASATPCNPWTATTWCRKLRAMAAGTAA